MHKLPCKWAMICSEYKQKGMNIKGVYMAKELMSALMLS